MCIWREPSKFLNFLALDGLVLLTSKEKGSVKGKRTANLATKLHKYFVTMLNMQHALGDTRSKHSVFVSMISSKKDPVLGKIVNSIITAMNLGEMWICKLQVASCELRVAS